MEIQEIFVVSNTHWDREFRFSFQRTRMLLVKMMDELLDLLERDKDYASYTLDSHSILVEDYLDVRPENKERIANLVKEKRLFIGPWYTLPDIPNIGPESVVRNLMFGHKIGEKFGHTLRVGYTPCSWGQISQLPQIYSGFGISSALFYRGISPHETTSEFIWEGADGTQILGHRFALFARYNYYYLVFRKITYGLDYNERQWEWGKDGETPFKITSIPDGVISGVELLEPEVRYIKENLAPALKDMLEIEGPHYAGPIFLAMNGHDISFPHPLESTVNKDSENLLPGIKIKHSDLEQYIERVKEKVDLKTLPILKGERRTNLKDGLWTYLLPGTLSARTPLKSEDTKAENLLTRLAEPLASILMYVCNTEYPSPFLNLAWKYFLSNHTHDANAGCAPDFVIQDVLYRIRQASEIAGGVIDESIKTIVKNIDTQNQSPNDFLLLLINPLPFSKTDVIDLVIDLPASINTQSFEIVDFDGKKYENVITRVEEAACFVDNKWNVPQTFITKRYYIKLLAHSLPSMGYQTLRIIPVPKSHNQNESLVISPDTMENEFLRVKINSNGTLDVTDKTTGKTFGSLGYFIDQGEVGNAWRHQAPSDDDVITSISESAKILKVEDTPLSATFRIDINLDIPEKCLDEAKRSDKFVSLPITQFITIKKGVRRVEILTRFENTAKDHWLRLVFPINVNTRVSNADSHFDVVERNIALPDCSGWKEPVVGTYPMHSFVDLADEKCGLSILVEGLKEFEILRERIPAIAISLVRGVRIKLEVAENRKQEIPDIGSQCPGILEFRTAIFPHQGKWSDAKTLKEAVEFNTPIKSAQFGKNKSGKLPARFSLFSMSSNSLVLTAMKKAERSDNLILRFYNPTSKELSEEIKFNIPIRKVWETNLNEERISESKAVDSRTIKIQAPPKKIITVEIEKEYISSADLGLNCINKRYYNKF